MPEPVEELVPYMEHFERFVADFRPDFLASEATVYSDRESYAGTLDFIAAIAHQTIITDVKTGKGVYPDAALQLCAYSRADYIGLPDGRDEPLPSIDGAAVLHLRPDGYEFIPVRIDDDVYHSFLFAREVFRWMEETSKTVLGAPLLGPEGVSWTWGVGETEGESSALT